MKSIRSSIFVCASKTPLAKKTPPFRQIRVAFHCFGMPKLDLLHYLMNERWTILKGMLSIKCCAECMVRKKRGSILQLGGMEQLIMP